MLLILIWCILIGHERPLISINLMIHLTFLRKTLFKRYQLLLLLLLLVGSGRTYKINDVSYKKQFLHLPDFVNNKILYIVILLLHSAKCFISVNKLLIRKLKTWQYFWLQIFITSFKSKWKTSSLWETLPKNCLTSFEDCEWTKKESKLIFSPHQNYSISNSLMKKIIKITWL